MWTQDVYRNNTRLLLTDRTVNYIFNDEYKSIDCKPSEFAWFKFGSLYYMNVQVFKTCILILTIEVLQTETFVVNRSIFKVKPMHTVMFFTRLILLTE